MALSPGASVGPHRILSAIGAGGMGEVYRARDERLNREVALKVLPEIFARDSRRLARFEREARVLASLNHPNIGAIYGLEDSNGVQALVLELVEGPTLADRIAQGPVPASDAFPIVRQIAEALEAAHEQGIIHRDLKPANIKVRADGTVKVLDFGLAKALEVGVSDSELSPTHTARETELGVILGTIAYMSPEQARGRAVDRRADIWAFGAVLYEMLAGRRAFEGDDVSATLASVLKDDVNWDALPPDLPAPALRVLRRCLERDVKRRLSAIADARLEIEDAIGGEIAQDAPAAVTRRWSRVVPWAIGISGAATAIGMLAVWQPWRRVDALGPIHTLVDVEARTSPTPYGGTAAVISPDGKMIAFVGGPRRQLHVLRLSQRQPVALPGTDGAISPFFSPDSRSVGFFSEGRLKVIAVTGGAAVTLADAPAGLGGSWGEDGTIVFRTTTGPIGFQRVPAGGGHGATVTALAPEERTAKWPQVLPGGQAVLYTSAGVAPGGAGGLGGSIGWDGANIMARALDGGSAKVVLRGGYYGRYVRSGHLLYVNQGTLYAVPFDLERLQTAGTAVPVASDVLVSTVTGVAEFSVSDTGTLLYLVGRSDTLDAPMHMMDAAGKLTVLRAEPKPWHQPRFSPDGRRLAVTIEEDIWIHEPDRGLTQLTLDPERDYAAVWAPPDGRRVAFASGRAKTGVANLYWMRSDGSGTVERLTDSPHEQTPFSFHPSGRHLAFIERTPTTSGAIRILPIQGDENLGWKPGKPWTFVDTPGNETIPMFSRDGRWVAYMSDASGTMEVYVRSFPSGNDFWKISTRGGGQPVWSQSADELLFLETDTNTVMVVSYTVQGNLFRTRQPRVWSPQPIASRGTNRFYDLHPDGRQIVMIKSPDVSPEQPDKVVMVLNFFDELRRLSATK